MNLLAIKEAGNYASTRSIFVFRICVNYENAPWVET